MRATSFLTVSLSALLAACDGPSAPLDAGTDAGSDITDPLRLDCEPLAPASCALPYPSSWFLREDPSTRTGYRVALGETTLPISRVSDRPVPPDAFNTRDGFSVNAGPMVLFPGAVATGLPRSNSIASSLLPDSPTVILDAETGERVAHFVDVDAGTTDDMSRALIFRQVRPFEHDRRYIVAIRGLLDEGGAAIEPSEVFRALRDGTPHDHPYVERRRADFEDIFSRLETAGVARADLQIAWDFHTSSLEDDTAFLTHMRDDALAFVGAEGPPYRITAMQADVDEHTSMQIEGVMEVPLYLANADAGPRSRLVLDASGMPMRSGTAEFPFVVIIPRSATAATPASPMHIGHGLLGSRFEATYDVLRAWANTSGRVLIATDWIGMAVDDVAPITLMLSQGRLEDFGMVPDRLCQGMVNALMLMRMVRGRFASDPLVMDGAASIIDTSVGYYYGGSQGGIFGATYMSVTTDVDRGVLAVPGQPYHMLLERSVDFDQFGTVLRQAITDGVDVPLTLALIQSLWDRADPGSYSRHIRSGMLANGHAHEALMLVAIGDHQVTTLGAHVMARAIGAPNLMPVNRTIYGIEDRAGPITGSAMIEFDFGLPPEPIDNVPMREGDDPHGRIVEVPAAFRMVTDWYASGVLDQQCIGACDVDDIAP